MQGYSLVQLCRPHKNGGGVAFYVKHNIKFRIRFDLSCITPEYEIISIEIDRKKQKPTIVSCVYRPPNTDISCFVDKMNSILELLESERKELYFMGDFNIDLLNYGSHNKTSDFLETMFSFNMLPLISKPSRISTNSATLIDNIFTNTFHDDKHSGLLYCDFTDHFPVYCILNNNNNNNSNNSNNHHYHHHMKKTKVTKKGIVKFKNKLINVDWSNVYNNDVNYC